MPLWRTWEVEGSTEGDLKQGGWSSAPEDLNKRPVEQSNCTKIIIFAHLNWIK